MGWNGIQPTAVRNSDIRSGIACGLWPSTVDGYVCNTAPVRQHFKRAESRSRFVTFTRHQRSTAQPSVRVSLNLPNPPWSNYSCPSSQPPKPRNHKKPCFPPPPPPSRTRANSYSKCSISRWCYPRRSCSGKVSAWLRTRLHPLSLCYREAWSRRFSVGICCFFGIGARRRRLGRWWCIMLRGRIFRLCIGL